MMNAETWLTPQEAVDCGLADGIIGETASIAPQNVMNAIGSGIPGTGMRRDAGHHGAAGQIHGGAAPHAGDGPGTHSINGR